MTRRMGPIGALRRHDGRYGEMMMGGTGTASAAGPPSLAGRPRGLVCRGLLCTQR